jgi:hypothetical protein
MEELIDKLRQDFPNFCGDSPAEGALQYLKDLVDWPARSVDQGGININPSQLVQEVRNGSEYFLEFFENTETELMSLEVITGLLSKITTQEQFLMGAEAALTKEWPNVESVMYDLDSIGVGKKEITDLVGTCFPHFFEKIEQIGRLRQVLRAFRRGLDELSKCWDRDKAAIQLAQQHLSEGLLLETQKALKILNGRKWTDIDSHSVEKELKNVQNET